MQKNRRMNSNRVFVIVLLILGAACLTVSAFYASSYLAIIGVSFLFWGGILFYIMPSKHVPITFLTASTTTNLINIERIINEYELDQKGIYLPPKNLKDTESSLLFIPKTQSTPLPIPDDTTVTGLISTDEQGVFLTPLGFSLSKLFEEKMGRSFIQLSIAETQKVLPKLLVEDLSIAEKIIFQTEGNNLTIELTGNLLNENLQETPRYPRSHNAAGCLLSSAIACILAKTTGKPVIIQLEEQNNNSTKFVFNIIEG